MSILKAVSRTAAAAALAIPLATQAQLTKLAATAMRTPLLPAPAQVTAKLSSPTEITVTWAAVPGATRYSISRTAPPVPLKVLSPNLTTPSFVDKSVNPGSRHQYYVVAFNAQNLGSAQGRSNFVDVPRQSGGAVPPGGTPAAATTASATASATAAAPKETRDQLAQRAYTDGMKKFAGKASPDQQAWKRAAAQSGLSFEELVAAYVPLTYAILTYKHVMQTEPDSAAVLHFINAMKSGTTWQNLWKEVAQSRQREQKFGYWAPAYVANVDEARRLFGLSTITHAEQCFGGLGDRCEGGIPTQVNNQVQPKWVNTFYLPDGTQMGYVDIGVAVGSIMHDNACVRDSKGLYCSGVNGAAMFADAVKTNGPAALEWNKASWNVIDHRTWRTTFGPYPVDRNTRLAYWFDDIRPVSPREAWMAPVLGIITIPDQNIRWSLGETRRSQSLSAPAGVKIDVKDAAFCSSKGFSRIETPLAKAPMGTCK